jgi:hypothetical protein
MLVQAVSRKLKAVSRKLKAASRKLRATSHKLQAASSEEQVLRFKVLYLVSGDLQLNFVKLYR